MSWLFTSGGQSTRASASASVLPVNIQSWFHLALTGWSPCCSRNSLECSLAPQFKSISSSVLSLFYGPTLTSIHDYWKNQFWLQTFVSKVMSLLSNTLSMFVKVFLPKSKHLLISWLQSPSTMILEPKKIVCHGSHCFPICHEVMGPYSMIFIFWMLSFKPVYSLSFFTLIKGLFSSSLLSAIRVVSSAYLRLLVFRPEILIPACDSSSLTFLLMFSE